jgi:hypothetical protein
LNGHEITVDEEEKLYKYRSLSGSSKEYTRAAICKREIYFASPSAFNDPFECRCIVDLCSSEEQWADLQASALLSRDPTLSRPQALNIARAKFPRPSDHQRGDLERSLRQYIISELEKDVGIFCLSRPNDDLLMWAHYADSHRGICLEFSVRVDPPFFTEAQPVRYQDSYPRFNYFNSDKDERAEKSFLTKSKHWAYEQEFRVVDLTRGPGIRQYPEELLTSVILGCAITPSDAGEVRSWVSSLPHPVPIRLAVREEARFALRIEPA